jgi:hypothetical protein
MIFIVSIINKYNKFIYLVNSSIYNKNYVKIIFEHLFVFSLYKNVIY